MNGLRPARRSASATETLALAAERLAREIIEKTRKIDGFAIGGR